MDEFFIKIKELSKVNLCTIASAMDEIETACPESAESFLLAVYKTRGADVAKHLSMKGVGCTDLAALISDVAFYRLESRGIAC